MLTEVTIKKMLPYILFNLGGSASKKEVCDFIKSHCNLDDVDDLQKSNSRNEERFVQRVGNIISHSSVKATDLVSFREGFNLMKTSVGNKIQWNFVLQDNNPITDLFNESNNIAKKIVFMMEQDYVFRHCPDKIADILWCNSSVTGYDIQSVCHDDPNKMLLILVKGTNCQDKGEAFELTSEELNYFKTHHNTNAELKVYCLYGNMQQKIYTQDQILTEFNIEPSVYRVMRKER